MSVERVKLQNRRGLKIAGALHLPAEGAPRATAVLAPCFSCTYQIAPIRDIARALERAQVAALRIDYAGTGESEGRFEDATPTSEAEDAADAARFLLARVGRERVHLVGHSLGGGVAFHAAIELGLAVASVTTIATDPRPDAFARIFGRDVIATAQRDGQVVVETGGGRYPLTRRLLDDLASHDFRSMIDALARAGVPMLHLHGETDLLVPLVEVRSIAEKSFGRPLEVVAKGDHLFADRDSRARLAERVVRFVRESE